MEVIYDWESKDKKIKKKILKEGHWEGTRPTEGSVCHIYVKVNEGNWDSSIKTEEDTVFSLGTGDTELEGLLERCLMTMDKSEQSLVQLGDTQCIITLYKFDPPDTPEYNYSLEQSVKVATEHKEKGIEHFKRGMIVEAYARFKRAIRVLIFAGKTEEKILPLYIAVCNNIALCHLKLDRPESGIIVCNKVLEHEPNNVKALLRRSTCYNMTRDFEKAHADLVKVLEIEPNNPTAKEMLPTIKADINDMNKRYKSMVKKMFSY